jgi:hypothetical protein
MNSIEDELTGALAGSTSVPFYTVPAAGGRITRLRLSLMRYVNSLSW